MKISDFLQQFLEDSKFSGTASGLRAKDGVVYEKHATTRPTKDISPHGNSQKVVYTPLMARDEDSLFVFTAADFHRREHRREFEQTFERLWPRHFARCFRFGERSPTWSRRSAILTHHVVGGGFPWAPFLASRVSNEVPDSMVMLVDTDLFRRDTFPDVGQAATQRFPTHVLENWPSVEPVHWCPQRSDYACFLRPDRETVFRAVREVTQLCDYQTHLEGWVTSLAVHTNQRQKHLNQSLDKIRTSMSSLSSLSDTICGLAEEAVSSECILTDQASDEIASRAAEFQEIINKVAHYTSSVVSRSGNAASNVKLHMEIESLTASPRITRLYVVFREQQTFQSLKAGGWEAVVKAFHDSLGLDVQDVCGGPPESWDFLAITALHELMQGSEGDTTQGGWQRSI